MLYGFFLCTCSPVLHLFFCKSMYLSRFLLHLCDACPPYTSYCSSVLVLSHHTPSFLRMSVYLDKRLSLAFGIERDPALFCFLIQSEVRGPGIVSPVLMSTSFTPAAIVLGGYHSGAIGTSMRLICEGLAHLSY